MPDTWRPPSAQELRVTFDSVQSYTVGIEDEVMLLDLDSFELVAKADQVLEMLPDDPG